MLVYMEIVPAKDYDIATTQFIYAVDIFIFVSTKIL